MAGYIAPFRVCLLGQTNQTENILFSVFSVFDVFEIPLF